MSITTKDKELEGVKILIFLFKINFFYELRIIRRLNLLVSQLFFYLYV